MGDIRHDAIVVTGWQEKSVVKANRVADELGLIVTPIAYSMNGYLSFLIAPDGSKEGWSDSQEGDKARDNWVAWVEMNKATHYLDWVHVSYGGDDPERAKLIKFNGELT